MDLEVARKALSKRSTFSPKRVAFFVVAGLCLVAGILLRSGQYFAQPEVELKAPVAVAPSPPPIAATPAVKATEPLPEPPPPTQDTAAPTENVEPTGKAVEAPEQADEAVEQPELPGPDMILVSRQPVAVLASPSSSATRRSGEIPAWAPWCFAAGLLLITLYLTPRTNQRDQPAHNAASTGRIEVVDGDTVRSNGQSFRLVGFNTPKSGLNGQCSGEREFAARATHRLQQLGAAGAADLQRVACACNGTRSQ